MDKLVSVQQLEVTYQVRRIDQNRSWFSQILRPQIEEKNVLKDLTLELGGAGITAILGRNGAGKTTLLKTLAGILTPASGEIGILGFDPAGRDARMLQQIGVIFGQKKMLWGELSLQENFAVTAAIYGIPASDARRRAAELTDLLDLARLATRPVKTFSLGESMKAEIANLLIFRPRLLFLDEPTIGLDVPAQRAIRAAIRQYVDAENAHIILTSHNMRDITELADAIYFLEDGRLSAFDRGREHDLELRLEERLVAP